MKSLFLSPNSPETRLNLFVEMRMRLKNQFMTNQSIKWPVKSWNTGFVHFIHFNNLTRVVLSRVHTSAKVHQFPLYPPSKFSGNPFSSSSKKQTNKWMGAAENITCMIINGAIKSACKLYQWWKNISCCFVFMEFFLFVPSWSEEKGQAFK